MCCSLKRREFDFSSVESLVLSSVSLRLGVVLGELRLFLLLLRLEAVSRVLLLIHAGRLMQVSGLDVGLRTLVLVLIVVVRVHVVRSTSVISLEVRSVLLTRCHL